MEHTKMMEMFYHCLESFCHNNRQKLYFLAESLEQGDYVIHPHIIASKWLMSGTSQVGKSIISPSYEAPHLNE